jgi:hypothetical protein
MFANATTGLVCRLCEPDDRSRKRDHDIGRAERPRGKDACACQQHEIG